MLAYKRPPSRLRLTPSPATRQNCKKEPLQGTQLPATCAATPRRLRADAHGAGLSRLASHGPLPEGRGRGEGGGAHPACSAALHRPPVLNRTLRGIGGGCGGGVMGAPVLPPAWQLYLLDHRISTYKKWPFQEGCSCTPEQMAEAGFIHCPTENEPDLAQCFFCFKELEGWEPDDSPMEEHRKHSPGCAFLTVKKKIEELTLSEFLKLDKERAKNKIAKESNSKLKEFEETSKTIRHSIERMAA